MNHSDTGSSLSAYYLPLLHILQIHSHVCWAAFGEHSERVCSSQHCVINWRTVNRDLTEKQTYIFTSSWESHEAHATVTPQGAPTPSSVQPMCETVISLLSGVLFFCCFFQILTWKKLILSILFWDQTSNLSCWKKFHVFESPNLSMEL